MIKNLMREIFLVFVSAYIFRKHKDIWSFKRHIQNQSRPRKIYLDIYNRYFRKLFGSWISYQSEFDGTPLFPHKPIGIFISGGSKIGKNVVIFQHVTIGSDTLADSAKRGSPIIGDNVYIGAGAKIIGNIRIGNNCRIGANTVVYKSMPSNSVAVPQPTRIITKDHPLDNRFFSRRNEKWMYFDDGKWIEDVT